jgi:hypothetical protein
MDRAVNLDESLRALLDRYHMEMMVVEREPML